MEKQNHKGVNDYDYDHGYGKLKDMQRWCGNQKFHDDVDKKLADIRKEREEKNKKNSDFSNGKSRWCGKKPDSIKINESQLRKMVSKIIKESLEELGYKNSWDEFEEGWYVCCVGNYGDVEVWVTDDIDDARNASMASEGSVDGPYASYEEADYAADQEVEDGLDSGYHRVDK
jgi:hypothetical protein